MIQVLIDVREQELINQIQNLITTIPSFKDLELKVENLPLGDVILGTAEETLLLIERKSINDLTASIKDGRYEEQSYRLNGLSLSNHNILYVIEGDLNKMNRFRDTRMDKLTLYSAIFSLNYTKGFSVIRTFTMEETAIFICNSAVKLKKTLAENKKGYYQQHVTAATQELENKGASDQEGGEKECSNKDYVNVVKKIKKENVTPENIAEIMLTQIPGISSVTALAIMEKYQTFSQLLKALEEDPDCLKGFSYQTEKGSTRKMNKTSIENIKKYLLRK
jgi:ERCC4-type nuclease